MVFVEIPHWQMPGDVVSLLLRQKTVSGFSLKLKLQGDYIFETLLLPC